MANNPNNKEQESKKLTYEQLHQVCDNLIQQNKELQARLQNSNIAITFKRLDYLFEVLKYSQHFPSDFIVSCTDEIVKAMTIEDKSDNK